MGYLVPTIGSVQEVLLEWRGRTIMGSCTCSSCRGKIDFDYCALIENEDQYAFGCPHCGVILFLLGTYHFQEAEARLGGCK